MNCARCQAEIEAGEEREHLGRILCEDCYMDALSPTRACDPWAVYSAKSALELEGGNLVNPLQEAIIAALAKSGGLELPELVQTLGAPQTQVEKELAALRHMEKTRAEMRDGRKVIVLW